MKTLKTTCIHYIIACSVMVLVAACHPRPAHEPVSQTISPARDILPTPTQGLPIPSTPTIWAPKSSAVSEISRYIFSSGISVEYPAEWVIDIYDSPGGPESIWLHPINNQKSSIGVEVAHRPLADRNVADPTTWTPNEGGYEIHWSQTISTGELDGLLFVWGVRLHGSWDGLPSLMAVFYDDVRELDIRLTTEFDTQRLKMADATSLEEVVNTQFEFFIHMIESLKFDETHGMITLTGVVTPGSELGEIKSYCPEGLYLVTGYENLYGQTRILLLREANPADQPVLYTDPQWKEKTVVVMGKYPAQDVYCEALICECEEYIIVDHIEAF